MAFDYQSGRVEEEVWELSEKKLSIAVVGGGVAGITAAHILSRYHSVVLLEKNDYIGGHTHTIVLPEGPDAGTPLDTGFIVCNDRNYPLFDKLLGQLGVELQNSNMSFGYYDEISNLQYSGPEINGVFAQRKNLFNFGFLGMLWDMDRFHQSARRDLFTGKLLTMTLGEYLVKGWYGKAFIRDYVIPMGSAIWSTSPAEMMEFPASTFVRFFDNHGLLTFSDRPQWQTVVGGSHAYVNAFLAGFRGEVRTQVEVQRVKRKPEGVHLETSRGENLVFDRLVLACHADEALKMLADPSPEEKNILSPWRYQKNQAVLHTDESVMPPLKRAWASWNYTREKNNSPFPLVSVTYHMNRIQGLEAQRQYFVSLNRQGTIHPDKILREITYTHPTYTREAVENQPRLLSLNGVKNTFYCGSYFGYGFHEDAVRSGVEVARCFGFDL